jgi:hypothetical protein
MEDKMDYKKFNETEEKYRILKGQLNNGEITPEELKKELKGMMIQDEEGNYWMIGGKTGKWYIYDGTDWKEENPYKEEEIIDASSEEIPVIDTYTEPQETSTKVEQSQDKAEAVEEQESVISEAIKDTKTSPSQEDDTMEAATIHQEPEDRGSIAIDIDQDQEIEERQEISREEIDESKPLLEKEIRTTPTEINCRVCKSKIPVFSLFCQICGANQKTPVVDLKKEAKPEKKEDELLITSVDIISMIFFLGGLGIIIGVLLGATFGAIKDFFMNHGLPIPAILEDTRGGIAGGLIFACIGGIGGFIVFAIASVIISSFCNLIAYIFGGIRFKIKT